MYKLEQCLELENAFRDLIDTGNRLLILNLEQVSKLNDDAITVLRSGRIVYRHLAGRMKLCRVEQIGSLYAVQILQAEFDVSVDEPSALALIQTAAASDESRG